MEGEDGVKKLEHLNFLEYADGRKGRMVNTRTNRFLKPYQDQSNRHRRQFPADLEEPDSHPLYPRHEWSIREPTAFSNHTRTIEYHNRNRR